MQKFIHGGDIYSASSPLGYWLDFSANINPLGLSAAIKKTIVENIDSLVHYPDPQGRALKQAISDFNGVPAENIVLGNGAAELFYLYFHTLHPQKVLLPVPSFSEYEKSALAAGAELKYFFLQEHEDFQLNFERLKQEMLDCQLVILGNPNNPTGELLLVEKLIDLLEMAAEREISVLVDESFLDFRADSEKYSVRDLIEEYPHLFVVTSLTKAFAVPGLRLGYGLANKALVEKLNFHKDTWNVNSLAQAAGITALSDVEYQQKTYNFINEVVPAFHEALQEIEGIKVYRPTVNFVLLKITQDSLTSPELVAKMKTKGILVRDCSNYPGLDDKFIRVAVKLPEDNALLVQALRECLKQ